VFISTEALPHDPVALHVLRALAEQVVAAGRVASHETAALALGLPLRRTHQSAEARIHVTRARTPQERTRRTGRLEVHLGNVPEHHVMTTPEGLRVTTPARTALDVAAGLDLPDALMIVDAAMRLELKDLAGSLDRSLYRNARLCVAAERPLIEAQPFAASPRTARHLDVVLSLANLRRESPLESWSWGHFHLAGLPEPALQRRLRTPLGDMYPDCTWEEFMVIGEADGEGKYADQSAFAREKEREAALRDLGWSVFRWTGREGFGTPDVVVGRARRALAAGGWIG
jgi:very-short-patch-repair endonuclease